MSVRTIGVLGAGQLGRLLALAGYPLGLRFEFLSDRPDDCAAHVAPHTVASYEHAEAVAAFARRCDVVTYEFENVPIAAAEAVLATGVPLRPNESILETAQDRVREKSALAAARIEVSAPRPVIEAEDARRAFEELGRRVVFKTRRDGYDGKGQRVVSSADEAARAYDELGGVELNAEPFVEFDRELSSIAVRGADGDVRFYPLTENHHERGILRRSISPAPNVSDAIQREANDSIARLMDEVDHVGVLTIEWFQVGDRLIANEIAPRVHNSGHWTLDAAATCQFENHLRAIAGWRLGPTHATHEAVMTNLVGDAPPGGSLLESDPDLRVHLYGKASRAGRKVGHATKLGQRLEPAPENATEGAAGRVPNR